jgi:thiol-disulfide isomerase/thioredoxin
MARPVQRLLILAGLLLLGLSPTLSYLQRAAAGDRDLPRPAPEFTHPSADAWLNTEPLCLADLQGRVVLLDFWTFHCWNCYRSFPWLKEVEHKLKDQPFTVVGVHSPEFAHEQLRDNVVAKVQELDLHHPVMMDNDFSYWKAMGNRYWPSVCVIDREGRIQARFFGETHVGDRNARAIEAKILELLR